MSLNQIITAAAIVAGTLVVAKVVDSVMLRRGRGRLSPSALTRYNALRRTVSFAIIVIGAAMALFVFPYVRGVAGTILTSAAFISIVIGLAAQATLANYISGLMISFSQPIRIGDHIEFQGIRGVVHEITATYTRVRTADGAWQLIPNALLASDTIRNATIVNPECVATVRMSVPLAADLSRVMATVAAEARAVPGTLEGREPTMRVQDLTTESAELEVDVWVPSHEAARDIASTLRLRVHDRLRRDGLLVTG